VIDFVIKDNPFAGGNKRIGMVLFVEFLRRNQLLPLSDGQPRIADNGMAALALLAGERYSKEALLPKLSTQAYRCSCNRSIRASE